MRKQKITGKLLITVLVLMSVLAPGGRILSAGPPAALTAVQEMKSPAVLSLPAAESSYDRTVTEDTYQPPTLLWQVGEQDNSSAEFTVFQDVYSENITLPANPMSWNTLSKGMKADHNGTMNLTFNLTEIPLYGVEFSFKVIDASTAIPQLAVFANGSFSGLIQITGLNDGETPLTRTWKQTYKLYIPKEQLKIGQNELKLTVDRGYTQIRSLPVMTGTGICGLSGIISGWMRWRSRPPSLYTGGIFIWEAQLPHPPSGMTRMQSAIWRQ